MRLAGQAVVLQSTSEPRGTADNGRESSGADVWLAVDERAPTARHGRPGSSARRRNRAQRTYRCLVLQPVELLLDAHLVLVEDGLQEPEEQELGALDGVRPLEPDDKRQLQLVVKGDPGQGSGCEVRVSGRFKPAKRKTCSGF